MGRIRNVLCELITGTNTFRLLIVENFIPPDVRDSLRERAYWDEDEDMWKLGKPLGTLQKSTTNEELLNASAADSGVVASEASTSIMLSPNARGLLDKRPVSSALFFITLHNSYRCYSLLLSLNITSEVLRIQRSR